MISNTIVINLFGGPGISKSTSSAKLFYELKTRHYNVELTNEYAKSLVYEESFKKIKNQLYLFAKQHNQIFRLNGVVDIIIMDSPLILSSIYDVNQSVHLRNLILDEHNKLNNLNFLIERQTEYKEEGRYHTLEEAKEVDVKIKTFLQTNNIEFIPVTISNIMEVVFSKLKSYEKFNQIN